MNWLSVIPLAVLVYPSFASGLAAPSAEANPFFQPWKTPFGVPPFEQIKNEHFLPALKKGIEEQRREVAAIAKNPEAANFSNTIEALDRAGELLERVQSVFSNLIGGCQTGKSEGKLRLKYFGITEPGAGLEPPIC